MKWPMADELGIVRIGIFYDDDLGHLYSGLGADGQFYARQADRDLDWARVNYGFAVEGERLAMMWVEAMVWGDD